VLASRRRSDSPTGSATAKALLRALRPSAFDASSPQHHARVLHVVAALLCLKYCVKTARPSDDQIANVRERGHGTSKDCCCSLFKPTSVVHIIASDRQGLPKTTSRQLVPVEV